MRKTSFANGEFYHLYNRGVDKRAIFSDRHVLERFFQSMKEFNVDEPIGSIYANTFHKNKLSGSTTKSKRKLVNFICYCLNPNHYHFILEQVIDKGVEKFMHKLSTGYTRYFNEKYQRSGSLFQGRFKAIHISSNEYLLHLSAYVNLNNRVHRLSGSTTNFVKSSWGEYTTGGVNFCNKEIVLAQFNDTSAYMKMAEESLNGIIERRMGGKDLDKILLE